LCAAWLASEILTVMAQFCWQCTQQVMLRRMRKPETRSRSRSHGFPVRRLCPLAVRILAP
jgi:hypothetical protein